MRPMETETLLYDKGSIQKEEYKLDLSSEITVSQEILGIAENFLSETRKLWKKIRFISII